MARLDLPAVWTEGGKESGRGGRQKNLHSKRRAGVQKMKSAAVEQVGGQPDLPIADAIADFTSPDRTPAAAASRTCPGTEYKG